MKKVTLFITIIALTTLFISSNMFAQGVSINKDGEPAHESAILDIDASDKGVLFPHVELVSANDPINDPAEGLVVYNTSPTAYDGKGYYYYDGSDWKPLGNQQQKIAFSASLNNEVSQNANSNLNPVIFGYIEFNYGGGYNASTGRFTVPTGQGGLYFFSISMTSHSTTSGDAKARLDVLHFDGNDNLKRAYIPDIQHFDERPWRKRTLQGTLIIEMEEGDHVRVRTRWEHGGGINVTWIDRPFDGKPQASHFMGYKIMN